MNTPCVWSLADFERLIYGQQFMSSGLYRFRIYFITQERLDSSRAIVDGFNVDESGFHYQQGGPDGLLGLPTFLLNGYGCFLGVEQPGSKAGHSPLSNAEVKNDWSLPPPPSLWRSTYRHGDTFTLSFTQILLDINQSVLL
jgi:hypothetical protein